MNMRIDAQPNRDAQSDVTPAVLTGGTAPDWSGERAAAFGNEGRVWRTQATAGSDPWQSVNLDGLIDAANKGELRQYLAGHQIDATGDTLKSGMANAFDRFAITQNNELRDKTLRDIWAGQGEIPAHARQYADKTLNETSIALGRGEIPRLAPGASTAQIARASAAAFGTQLWSLDGNFFKATNAEKNALMSRVTRDPFNFANPVQSYEQYRGRYVDALMAKL
jgi:hypothetical protein